MLQFYFLSILLNIVTGLILVYATDFYSKSQLSGEQELIETDSEKNDSPVSEDGDESDSKMKLFTSGLFLDDMTFRLVVGILSALVGLMKLLSTVQNDVPVIGDLIPAVAGLAGAFALLIEYYSQKSDVNFTLPAIFNTIFVGGRKYLGIFCILAGILHFVFPRVLFL